MTASAALTREIVEVAAPFAMPPIAVPDFADRPRFDIAEFGARPDDQAATAAAVAAAIDQAHAAGGGVVVVPEGAWPTGPVHLKSRVALHLAEGAVLAFSPDPADYLPAVPTSWEGIECLNYSPLVYAYDCEDVALTGPGKLKARLDVWKSWYDRPRSHLDALVELYQMGYRGDPLERRDMAVGLNHLRPHFVQFNRCRHVLIEDVSIEDSPFWVVHPYLCRDVVIRRIKVRAHGHNNDGVDPEMSQNVLIEDCLFDQGDDAISLKAGRDFDAWRLATPTAKLVMRRCRVVNGHHLVAIGSELSGGVEDVLIEDCRFEPDLAAAPAAANSAAFLTGEALIPATENNLLYVKTNERRGGFVRNIHLRGVSAGPIGGGVLSIETDVLYQWRTLSPTYRRALTAIEGVHIENVEVESARFLCYLRGEAEAPIRDVSIAGARIGALSGEAVDVENVVGLRIEAGAAT